MRRLKKERLVKVFNFCTAIRSNQLFNWLRSFFDWIFDSFIRSVVAHFHLKWNWKFCKFSLRLTEMNSTRRKKANRPVTRDGQRKRREKIKRTKNDNKWNAHFGTICCRQINRFGFEVHSIYSVVVAFFHDANDFMCDGREWIHLMCPFLSRNAVADFASSSFFPKNAFGMS